MWHTCDPGHPQTLMILSISSMVVSPGNNLNIEELKALVVVQVLQVSYTPLAHYTPLSLRITTYR